jgi:NADH-quinone oxidoreductase subunit G
MSRIWGAEPPAEPGLGTGEILAGAAAGDLRALVVGGVELTDLPDPVAALTAVEATPFVLSLELRESAVTDRADVVLPVSPVVRKSGTFVDWEGRPRSFDAALPSDGTMPDQRVLDALAHHMGLELGLPAAGDSRDELARLGPWDGDFPGGPSLRDALSGATSTPATAPPVAAAGEAILSSWRMLLDSGRLQDGEPHLAGTARRPVMRLCAATAAENGLSPGELVTVSTDRGSITLPLEVTELPERVVWVPLNSPGSPVYSALGPALGQLVRITRAEDA